MAHLLLLVGLLPLASVLAYCGQGKMYCGTCVSQSQICDGIKNCKGDYDEMNCNKTRYEGCPPKYFGCYIGGCVWNVWICDGHSHCADGSDEEHCTTASFCPEDTFQCAEIEGQYKKVRRCVAPGRRCDGNDDCRDGQASDEVNCTTTTQNQFTTAFLATKNPVTDAITVTQFIKSMDTVPLDDSIYDPNINILTEQMLNRSKNYLQEISTKDSNTDEKTNENCSLLLIIIFVGLLSVISLQIVIYLKGRSSVKNESYPMSYKTTRMSYNDDEEKLQSTAVLM